MIGLKLHDRYVLRAFWTAFGAVLVFFTVIVVLIHLADRGTRLTRHFDALRAAGYDPVMLTVEHYATLVPFLWLQVVPLAAVLAAAFGLSRLTRHNELGPLVSTGVSTRRVTLPIVVSGVVLVGLLFGLQEVLVPSLSRRHMVLSRLLGKSEPDRVLKVPHFDDPGGARLSMAAFQPMARRVEGALLTFRDPEGSAREMRFYPLLEWDGDRDRWIVAEDGTRFPLQEGETGLLREPLPAGAVAPLEADVQLLEVSVLKDLALGLSARETASLLAADPDSPRLLLMHHQQFTRCLSPLVLLLLGLPFCLRLGRTGALPGTVAVLASGAVLYALVFLTSRLATSGALNPVVMAWCPTVLLGCVGFALWLTMRS